MDEKLIKALYFFEHQLIPDYFFDEDLNFVLTLRENPKSFLKFLAIYAKTKKLKMIIQKRIFLVKSTNWMKTVNGLE